MDRAVIGPDADVHAGIRIRGRHEPRAARRVARDLRARLADVGLARHVEVREDGGAVAARLSARHWRAWTPGFDTTALAGTLASEHGADARALERETLVSMLASPTPLEHADLAAFDSAVRVRLDTVAAAAGAELDFDCDERRPEDCWTRDDEGRFVLRPGTCLIEALSRAIRPGPDARPYGFGCYRATEYVMLLAIAQEAARVHPELLERLRRRTERRPIQSREFHDTLLVEHGTSDAPLPARWLVPGDRVWFRNPHERSADVEGYEGSWVIYLGAGHFGNFWKRGRPFTFTRKCVEVFHWRHAVYTDGRGRLRIDEDEVERRCAETLADPDALATVLSRMQRWRDLRGTYAEGGCIDRTRESARCVTPEGCEIELAPR